MLPGILKFAATGTLKLSNLSAISETLRCSQAKGRVGQCNSPSMNYSTSNPPCNINSFKYLFILILTFGGSKFIPSLFSKNNFAFVLSTVSTILSNLPNSLNLIH